MKHFFFHKSRCLHYESLQFDHVYWAANASYYITDCENLKKLSIRGVEMEFSTLVKILTECTNVRVSYCYFIFSDIYKLEIFCLACKYEF